MVLDADIHSFKYYYAEFIKNDGVIDKWEFAQLKKIADRKDLKDKEFAKSAILELSGFRDKTRMTVRLGSGTGSTSENYKFIFTPTYSEYEDLSGNTPFQIASNISQNDTLKETTNDGYRCGAASLLNAYLLLGGNFDAAAERFGSEKGLSYKNIHLLQEKIYNFANQDGVIGLETAYNYFYDDQGKITSAISFGEVTKAANKLGLVIRPALGNTKGSLNQKRDAITGFFRNNPSGVLQVGVHLNEETGDVTAATFEGQNHYVAVFKQDNGFFMADSGRLNNGDGQNVRQLTPDELDSMVYSTTGIVNELTLRK